MGASNMPDLTWDANLATVASNWAAGCTYTHNEDRTTQYDQLAGSTDYVGTFSSLGQDLSARQRLTLTDRAPYLNKTLNISNDLGYLLTASFSLLQERISLMLPILPATLASPPPPNSGSMRSNTGLTPTPALLLVAILVATGLRSSGPTPCASDATM